MRAARRSSRRCGNASSRRSASRRPGTRSRRHPARGHAPEGETGHRPVPRDVYPAARHPSGGLWSTVERPARLRRDADGTRPVRRCEPRVEALGARYGLGWWVRTRDDGVTVVDHEGSVAGYQSLLLLVPEERLALAVLTNSWRGSGLVRRVVERLALAAAPAARTKTTVSDTGTWPGGTRSTAPRRPSRRPATGSACARARLDPVTGDRIEQPSFAAEPLGGGVYGFAGGLLMSHRLDFPQPGFARVGWVALPRAKR